MHDRAIRSVSVSITCNPVAGAFFESCDGAYKLKLDEVII